MRWQDNFRMIRKDTEENGRNDYTRFKSKHFTLGLLTPKKIERVFKVAVLCDTSGSMDMQNDITKGISQLTNLSGASGYLTWADAEIYWDKTITLDKFSSETLKGVKVTGRGGTEFLSYFNEYEKRFKDEGINMIVVITDGFLYSGFDKIKKPKVPVMWLITNHGEFRPSFGKVYNIHNE
jgi:predicted metal-dependent peptidase